MGYKDVNFKVPVKFRLFICKKMTGYNDIGHNNNVD